MRRWLAAHRASTCVVCALNVCLAHPPCATLGAVATRTLATMHLDARLQGLSSLDYDAVGHDLQRQRGHTLRFLRPQIGHACDGRLGWQQLMTVTLARGGVVGSSASSKMSRMRARFWRIHVLAVAAVSSCRRSSALRSPTSETRPTAARLMRSALSTWSLPCGTMTIGTSSHALAQTTTHW
jgi:hypothetical protein